jgi:hypothetical protein
VNQPIIINTHTETKRDCIIGQDGKRYCEDSGEDVTAAEGGLVILGVVAFCVWFIFGLLRSADRDWGWRLHLAYWAGPWVALAVGLLVK